MRLSRVSCQPFILLNKLLLVLEQWLLMSRSGINKITLSILFIDKIGCAVQP